MSEAHRVICCQIGWSGFKRTTLKFHQINETLILKKKKNLNLNITLD